MPLIGLLLHASERVPRQHIFRAEKEDSTLARGTLRCDTDLSLKRKQITLQQQEKPEKQS